MALCSFTAVAHEKCLAPSMRAILTVTVTRCDLVLWEDILLHDHFQFVILVRSRATFVLCAVSAQPFLKFKWEILALFFSLTRVAHNFPSANCMQSTDNKHSISQLEKRACTSWFCSRRKNEKQPVAGQNWGHSTKSSGTGLHHLTCERACKY